MLPALLCPWKSPKQNNTKRTVSKPKRCVRSFLVATRVYKPGSVLTAIYLGLKSLSDSSRLLGAVGQTYCSSTALLRDRVYIVQGAFLADLFLKEKDIHLKCPTHVTMGRVGSYPTFSPLLPGIEDARLAVYLCCTCPEVPLGGRYPLSLPYEARTFLIWSLSASIRGCPTRSRKYCTAK